MNYNFDNFNEMKNHFNKNLNELDNGELVVSVKEKEFLRFKSTGKDGNRITFTSNGKKGEGIFKTIVMYMPHGKIESLGYGESGLEGDWNTV